MRKDTDEAHLECILTDADKAGTPESQLDGWLQSHILCVADYDIIKDFQANGATDEQLLSKLADYIRERIEFKGVGLFTILAVGGKHPKLWVSDEPNVSINIKKQAPTLEGAELVARIRSLFSIPAVNGGTETKPPKKTRAPRAFA